MTMMKVTQQTQMAHVSFIQFGSNRSSSTTNMDISLSQQTDKGNESQKRSVKVFCKFVEYVFSFAHLTLCIYRINKLVKCVLNFCPNIALLNLRKTIQQEGVNPDKLDKTFCFMNNVTHVGHF